MSTGFTKEGIWWGGFYELALELGEPSDARLSGALKALWSHPSLDGCYLERDKEPAEQPRVSPGEYTDNLAHLQGLAMLPSGKSVVCGTVNIREEGGGPDWLDFYIPIAALGDAYAIGPYPFTEDEASSKVWQQAVDNWLVELGRYVYGVVPFRLGLIGWEMSGHAHASEIAERGIPEQRYEGYLWPRHHELEWYPPNTWPLITAS